MNRLQFQVAPCLLCNCLSGYDLNLVCITFYVVGMAAGSGVDRLAIIHFPSFIFIATISLVVNLG